MSLAKRPTIAAILPNYNYAEYFSSRLDEVLAQTYPVSEIIILDDASTDASISCIKTKLAFIKNDYPKIKFKTAFNVKNSGSVFSQWQKGIKLASSDYIWIAELDDSADPRFLETVIAPALNNPDVVLSYTNSKLVGAVSLKDRVRQLYDFTRHGRSLGSYVAAGNVEVDANLSIFNSIPNVSACLIKNLPELPAFLDDAKQYKLSGDWFFYLQLLKFGNIAYSPKRLNSHRLSKTSVTGRTDYALRLAEIQKIHAFATATYNLSSRTLRRMSKLEQSLARNWGLPDAR